MDEKLMNETTTMKLQKDFITRLNEIFNWMVCNQGREITKHEKNIANLKIVLARGNQRC